MAEQSATPFQAMNDRRKREEFCDFEIKVERKTFPVHRLVLDTCSEYFRSMFASKMREYNEGFCELKDDEPDVVEICIEFMYTGELDINADMVIKVLKLAHMWQLTKAVEICENHLCCNLSATCCFLYQRLAILYGLQNLLFGCHNFIFSNTEMLLNSKEIADISFTELETLLKEWKYRRAVGEPTGMAVTMPTSMDEQATQDASEASTYDKNEPVFWKLCAKWATYHDNSAQFCKIVEQYVVSILPVEYFIKAIMEDKHIKECEKCKESVCKRFLGNLDTNREVSTENCLILKDLANCYDCEDTKQELEEFITKNYKTVFLRPEFNRLVPPDDFVAYIAHLQARKFSSQIFSVIALWIKFSPDREDIFPKLFKEKFLNFDNLTNLFKLEDAFFIKELSCKYSCPQVRKLVDKFIIENFTEIIKLPESLQMNSMDLISYLQRFKPYGDNPAEIWNFILKWINNHDMAKK